MPSFHVRLTDPAGIVMVRRALEEGKIVLVSFAAQMTHYPLLIGPDTAFTHIGFEKSYGGGPTGSGYHYVGLMEYGGLYPFQLGYLHAGYVKEKLKLRHRGCAGNITVFLNALGHPDGVYNYLSTIPMMGDHPDHESEALHV